MKLIDKDILVAEIERLKSIYNDDENIHHVAKYNILVDIISFLDTLEVKEVDLEKEIDFYTESSLTGTNPIYTKGAVSCIIEKTAKHFFELGIKVAQKGE